MSTNSSSPKRRKTSSSSTDNSQQKQSTLEDQQKQSVVEKDKDNKTEISSLRESISRSITTNTTLSVKNSKVVLPPSLKILSTFVQDKFETIVHLSDTSQELSELSIYDGILDSLVNIKMLLIEYALKYLDINSTLQFNKKVLAELGTLNNRVKFVKEDFLQWLEDIRSYYRDILHLNYSLNGK